MQAADLLFLQSAAGQAQLAALAREPLTPERHLALAAQLRQLFTPAQVHALLETARLRHKAAAKFSRPERFFFTAAGLEMCSAEGVATYRAQRYRRAGCQTIIDLGCGLGGDALALAQVGAVVGVEIDPLALALAEANLVAAGLGECFTPLVGDLEQMAPRPADALFFDPARRDATGRRLHSVYAYRPPLSALERWRALTPAAGAKLSPGVDLAELPPQVEVEFISVQGELREAVVWWGALHSGVSRRATLLDDPIQPQAGHSLTDAAPAPAPPLAVPCAYLLEPDSAILRAGLVAQLAAQLGAAQLDPTIAYLTADAFPATPWGRIYALEAWFPFQLKRLRAYLRAHGVGRVVIKKRGSPLEVDSLTRQLRLHGSHERTLFLTRCRGEPVVLVGMPEAEMDSSVTSNSG